MGNTGSLHEITANCQSDIFPYYRHPRIRTTGNDRGGIANKIYQKENNLSSSILSYESGGEKSFEQSDWAKSFPRTKPTNSVANESSSLSYLKVLPHLNETLKLRPTANGTILHSGGTIRGRREYQQHQQSMPELLGNTRLHQPMLMQRARTLIYERVGDGAKKQIASDATDSYYIQTVIPVLRRAQTQLNCKDIRQQQQDIFALVPKNEAEIVVAAPVCTTTRSEPDLRYDTKNADKGIARVPATTNKDSENTKTNKYNKKRKAPAIPYNITSSLRYNSKALSNSRRQSVDVNNNRNIKDVKKINQISTSSAAEQPLGKSRIFLTDSNEVGARKKSIGTVVQQLPYRREKSFDSTLLYQQRHVADQQQHQQHTIPSTLQHQSSRQKVKTEDTRIPQLKSTFYFGMDTRRTAAAPITEAASIKGTTKLKGNATKLPGLTSSQEQDKQQMPRRDAVRSRASETADKTTSISSASIIMATAAVYDISVSPKQFDNDDNDKNGLQVHVRPTLPRRQLDIPRFSPTAAWRMLTEEQKNLQLQTHSIKIQANQQQIFCSATVTNIDTSQNNEQPIKPVCKALKNIIPTTCIDLIGPKKLASKDFATTPWTPQQDLEGDDDNDGSSSDEFNLKIKTTDANSLVESSLNISLGKDNSKCQNATSVHVFSLSLPRDGHFSTGFCDNKHIIEKKSPFSSLQKLKRTVSGGNQGYLQTKCSDEEVEQMPGTVTDQFKTDYDDFRLTTSGGMLPENKIHSNVYDAAFSNGYRSDNWVLSKTKFGIVGKRDTFHEAAKLNFSPAMNTNKLGQRWNTLVSIEPVSLSYLTAGKHVMYLPGHNNLTDHSYLNKVSATDDESNECEDVEIKQNHKIKSCKRELHTRQSLQDLIPLGISDSRSKCVTKRDLSSEWRSLQNEKQQRFSFQSTVRLIEKRRLAEKLSKDAEVREAQRRIELEAMKRVEEDFQRKRATEKATIRQQLRLVSNLDTLDQQLNQYQSLPVNSDYLPMKYKHFHDLDVNQLERLTQNPEDANNNTYYRADPDGAASSPSNSPVMQFANNTEDTAVPFNSRRTFAESFQNQNCNSNFNIAGKVLEFQNTPSLDEPYLQSIVK